MESKHVCMHKVIVIGNGMVGYKFCEKFVAQNESKNFEITVFGEEPRPAYDRVHLSEFFESQDAKALELAPIEWYSNNGIELIVGERVSEINRSSKEIKTAKGRKLTYDYLVLATGSSAFVPPIKGVEKEGVFVYRTIEDLEGMLSYAEKLKKLAKDIKYIQFLGKKEDVRPYHKIADVFVIPTTRSRPQKCLDINFIIFAHHIQRV